VTYNGIGQLTSTTLGNGVTETYGYDANRMQLTSQTATQSGGATNGLMNLTYGYQALAGQMGAGTTAGNAGQLMAISGTIGGVTESAAYTYDDLGRLVTSNQTSNLSSAQRRFAYDRWGNRTGMWDATSGGNQIQSITLQQSDGAPTNRITSVTSASTVNYSYDAAGNVTNDGVHAYAYDSENRVVSVDGGATASYAYDNQNRRYKKTVGSTATHYVWESSQVIAEHNGSTGAVLIDYVYSGGRMIATVASGSTQYLLFDRLSVRLSLDQSGNVIGRQGHLPFGEDLGESGTQQKHHFTSYERDSESETDYAVNRTFQPAVGRFLSLDSEVGNITNPQRVNRYAYTRNDPINRTDRLGLDDAPNDEPCQSWNPETGQWEAVPCGPPLKLSVTSSPLENKDVVDWSKDTGLFIDGWSLSPVTTSNPSPQDPSGRPVKSACAPDKKGFFNLLPLFRDMATQLNIDVRFLLALSAKESGWNGEHAQELHNLFGVTHGGGNNFNYSSYDEAARDWIRRYSSYVASATTIDDFVAGLKKAGYNSLDKKYYDKIKKMVESVDKYASLCNVKP